MNEINNKFISATPSFTNISTFELKLNVNEQILQQEGDMTHSFAPFKNLQLSEDGTYNGNTYKKGQLIDFDTTEIKVNLNNPITMDVQPSYDGSVNLIINDDDHPPRIINSRFTAVEDSRYQIIDRTFKNTA